MSRGILLVGVGVGVGGTFGKRYMTHEHLMRMNWTGPCECQ